MIEPRATKTELRKRRFPLSTHGPFHTANNLHLFYGGADRGAISEGIAQQLRKSPEPVVISGEPGSGKTLLSLVLADKLKIHYNVIRYEHARIDSASLLRHLLIEISPQAAVALSRNLLENLEPSVQRADFVKSKALGSSSKSNQRLAEDSFAEKMSRGAAANNAQSLEHAQAGVDSADTEFLDPDQANFSVSPQALPFSGDFATGAEKAEPARDQHLLESMFTSIRSTLEQGTSNNKPVLLILDAKESPDEECLSLLYRLAQTTNRYGNVFRVALFLTSAAALSPYASRQQQASLATSVSQNSTASKNQNAASDLRPDFLLRRLSLAEVSEYLQHHMLLFDFNKRNLFNRDMAYFIADRTDGNFKAINVLARNAFMLANLEGAEQMSMSHLLMAGLPQKPEKEPCWFQSSRKSRRLVVGMLSMVFVAVSAVVVFRLL